MPQIPNEIIEQVAAANDIVEVIGSYFPLKRAGGAFKALCPFHNERSPSFTVTPQRQMFKCFGCGAGGSVFRFVMDYEHLSFVEAVRKLAEKAGIRIPEAEMSSEDFARSDLRRRLLALHGEAADFFHTCLMRTKAGEGAREYLKKRGLGGEVARGWKIGFSPDSYESLLHHARGAGFADAELRESGLFAQKEESGRLYDRFRGRVMFPICNDTGEVIAFSGRVLSAEQSPAKYVNSPETMLFTKGAVLFGLHKSKRALVDKKQAVVCEGQIDLITLYEHGVKNVIAPQGTAFTERQARILKRYVEEVVLCFDADAAGDKAAERSLPHLLGESLLVRVLEMPPGEDPDTLVRGQGAEAFAERVTGARDFFEFQIERHARRPEFATPRGKIAAARKLAEFISLIPEEVTRETVLNNASMRLEITPTQLRTLLKKPQEARYQDEDAALDTPLAEPIAMDTTQHWLVQLALRHSVSRAWLQAQSWERVLEDGTAGSALLGRILAAAIRPDDPASLSVWMSTLTMQEEQAIASLPDSIPADAKLVTEDCWHELERRHLLRHRDLLTSRARAPGLSLEDMAKINTQLLEVRQRITSLPPPRAPKMAAE